jgi:hypothetical protein
MRRISRHSPRNWLAIVESANQQFTEIMTIAGSVGQFGVRAGTQKEVRVPAVLNHVVSRNDYWNFHLHCVIDRGLKVNVLAQYQDGFNVGPAASDLLYVSRDPDTAGAVDHLLLNNPTGLPVELPQENVAAGNLDPLAILVVGGVLAGESSPVAGPSERQPDMHGRNVEVVPT